MGRWPLYLGVLGVVLFLAAVAAGDMGAALAFLSMAAGALAVAEPRLSAAVAAQLAAGVAFYLAGEEEAATVASVAAAALTLLALGHAGRRSSTRSPERSSRD